MGAHESGDDGQRMQAGQLLQRLQLFQFGLQVQAVAALGFQGRGAAEQHLVEPFPADRDQVRQADGPGFAHRALDAAAAAGDLLVADALQLQPEFILARAGKREVGVGIDEARAAPGRPRRPLPAPRAPAGKVAAHSAAEPIKLMVPCRAPIQTFSWTRRDISFPAADHAVGAGVDQLADIFDERVGGDHISCPEQVALNSWKLL